MIEKWKRIDGYENLYEVSNLGRIKSLYSNKILKPVIESSGYNQVTLVKNKQKKKYYIHRLVCLHFLENPHNFKEINHIDGNKSNNCIINLEWCNRQYNVNHSVKILKRQLGKRIKVKCIETGQVFDSLTKAAQFYHQHSTNLSSLLRRGKCKTFAGYHWKYV